MKYYTNWFQAKSFDAQRVYKEDAQKYRNNFQKDRDRILYSKSFRRLSGKTQVFLTGQNDHLRTRLTHSIEVNQIAKTISNSLNLNLDLTEAVALGHDIGHTPFGHIGERTLNFIMNGCEPVKEFNKELPESIKGFKHNLQALRILSSLERSKEYYDGLNISNYTLWGIVNHTNINKFNCKRTTFDSENQKVVDCYFNHSKKLCNQSGKLVLDFYDKYLGQLENSKSWSIEGLVVRLADEIAQRHHDIEDGIVTGLLKKDDIVELIDATFGEFFDKKIQKSFDELRNISDDGFLSSYVSSFIVNFLVLQLIIDSKCNLKALFYKYNMKKPRDFSMIKEEIFVNEDIFKIIEYNGDFKSKEKESHDYLKDKILNSYIAQKMDGKAEYIIRKLFDAFVSNPQQLPDRTILYFVNDFLGNTYVNSARKKYSERNLIGGIRSELKSNFERNDNQDYKHFLLRTICDYIAGMTDNYAYNQFELLYGSTRIT